MHTQTDLCIQTDVTPETSWLLYVQYIKITQKNYEDFELRTVF